MSHKGIRLLLEDTAKSLGDDIQFDYGRTTDFNLLRDKKYPFISCSPLTATAEYAVDNSYNYSKTYQVSLAFYQLDKEGSGQDDYALILDEMNNLADKYVNKLNFYAGSDCVPEGSFILTGINQQPFIKATADILTGYFLTFSIQITDNFDYCGLDC